MIDLKELRCRVSGEPTDQGVYGPTWLNPREAVALLDLLDAVTLDAARYEWLSRRVSGHGVCDGWAIGFPTHLTIPASALAMKDPQAALGEAIDAAMAATKGEQA